MKSCVEINISKPLNFADYKTNDSHNKCMPSLRFHASNENLEPDVSNLLCK